LRADRDRARSDGKLTQEPAAEATIGAIDAQDAFFQHDSMVITELTGKEVSPPSANRRTRVQNTLAWYQNNLVRPGKAVTHAETGMKIEFDGAGRKKLSGLPDDRLRLVPAIPEIWEKGRYEGPEPGKKGRANIKAWHHFIGTVEIAGESITVRLAVWERTDGIFHYSLDRQVDRGGGWTESRAGPEGGNATAFPWSAAPAESNVPPLDRDDNSLLRRSDMTPRFAEARARAELRMQGIGRQIFGRGFDVCVVDSIAVPDGGRPAGLYRVARRPGQGQQPLAQGAVSPSERRRRKRQSGRLTGRTPSFSVAATEGLLRN